MHNSIEDLLNESISALDEEIKEIKRRGYGSRIQLKDGVLISSEGDHFIYNFTLDNLSPLPDNTPVKLQIDNESYSGSILKSTGLEITLVIEKNIGEEVPKAVMSASPERLLEALRDRLVEVEGGNMSLNLVSTKKLFGYENITNFFGDKPKLRYKKGKEPFPRQWEAIRHVLGSEITFVWGPPGTGKTTTLGRIVEALLQKNKRILVLSHTNVATDKATEEIIEYNENILDRGGVIRFGNIVEDKIKDETKVQLDKIAEEKTYELRNEKGNYENQLRDFGSLLNTLKSELELHKLRDEYNKRLQTLRNHLVTNQMKVEEAQNISTEFNYSLSLVLEDLDRAMKSGKLVRFFKRLDPQKLVLQKVKITMQIRLKENELRKLKEVRDSIVNEIKTTERELLVANNRIDFEAKGQKDWENEPVIERIDTGDHEEVIVICPFCEERLKLPNSYGEYYKCTCPVCKNKFNFSCVRKRKPIPLQKLKKEIKEINKTISDVETIVKAIDEKIKAIEESVLRDAKVIVTSITQGYLSEKIYGDKYDVLIVDEASMIPLPALFFVSGLSKEKIVVVGDFCQLPPISISKENKLLKTDIFNYVGIKSKVESGQNDNRLAKLNEQFRMWPQISEITSKYVYEPRNNKLDDAEKVKKRKEHPSLDKQPCQGHSVVFYDTSTINPWCNQTPGYSRCNLYNAILTVNLLKEALYDGVPKTEIGVITPYTAQSRLINKILEQEDLREIKISTIHKFQGLEKDVMIFDTVEGSGARLGHFFYSKDESLRLINVAITRSKSKLIIVGNMKYLEGKLNKEALMYKIIQHIKKYGKVEGAEDIIAKYSEEMLLRTEKRMRAIPIDLKGMSVFTQRDFYEMFEKDLLSATKGENIVIFSPFLSLVKLSTLMDKFRIVRDKGANIMIVTPPASKQEKLFQSQLDETIEYMESIGIQIKRKRKMHYKRAFIFNRIWWEGSLNILSHRDTLEDMLRFEQRDVVEFAIDSFGIKDLISGREEELKRWRTKIKEALSKFEERCEKCGKIMRVVVYNKGTFLGCENRKCGNTKNIKYSLQKQAIEEAGISCPKCSVGIIEVKYSPKTRHIFYGCSNYPDCKFIVSFR